MMGGTVTDLDALDVRNGYKHRQSAKGEAKLRYSRNRDGFPKAVTTTAFLARVAAT